MTFVQRLLQSGSVVLLCSTALVATPRPARGCGYHDPYVVGQLMSRMLIVNQYPNANEVHGSVWEAQLAGHLDRKDYSKSRDQAYQEATAALERFGAGLKAVGASGAQATAPDTALFLLDSVLWSRFLPQGEDVTLELHVSKPDPADLVVITEEAALFAITEGRLSLKQAFARGFLRLYGTAEQQQRFLTLAGALGGSPLPAPVAEAQPSVAHGLTCTACGCPTCAQLASMDSRVLSDSLQAIERQPGSAQRAASV